MNTYFTKNPIVGTPLTPSVIRQIHTAVRRFMPIAGNGIRTSVTAGGTIISATARNERDRRASPDMGCWKIVRKTRDDEGEMLPAPVRVFENQFYLMGGVMKELELEDTVEDFVCQGELEEGEEYTDGDRPFVALKVPATTDSTDEPTLAGFADVEELHAAQADTAYVVKPLYKFTHDGSVAVDFRNCPTLQVEEML